ncbi:hypothetical protein OH76DRAFT_842548 [Lentinus brumalis]|uniref:Uncharacterized protein n=1 Tax=Lentinus brumalis TaxID=2498619 RepID=A0A371D1R1_9APHY|nr:hypothetical protein OH76DRAFT_842548 [Polyporus brumalis]
MSVSQPTLPAEANRYQNFQEYLSNVGEEAVGGRRTMPKAATIERPFTVREELQEGRPAESHEGLEATRGDRRGLLPTQRPSPDPVSDAPRWPQSRELGINHWHLVRPENFQYTIISRPCNQPANVLPYRSKYTSRHHDIRSTDAEKLVLCGCPDSDKVHDITGRGMTAWVEFANERRKPRSHMAGGGRTS